MSVEDKIIGLEEPIATEAEAQRWGEEQRKMYDARKQHLGEAMMVQVDNGLFPANEVAQARAEGQDMSESLPKRHEN